MPHISWQGIFTSKYAMFTEWNEVCQNYGGFTEYIIERLFLCWHVAKKYICVGM